MKPTTRALLLTSLAVVVAGCEEKSQPTGATGEPAHSDVAPRPGQARHARPAAPPVVKPSGRDVKKLNACEIVTGADVAKLTGGKLESPSNNKGSVCGYVLELNAKTVSYQLSFWEPQMFESMFDAAPAGQLGEKVDGPWSIGYLDKGFAEGTYSLSVVWRGDVAMEAQGDGKDAVVKLANLAASRLPPP